jgi:hypothetical protein
MQGERMKHVWTTQGGRLFDGALWVPFETRCLNLPQTRLTTANLDFHPLKGGEIG